MKKIVTLSQWSVLEEFTDARIALGRAGVSLPTKESLSFLLDHARAKDAVMDEFEPKLIASQSEAVTGIKTLMLESSAADRREYLMRPDLGRKLSESSHNKLTRVPGAFYDLSITAADGLSPRAIHENFAPFMRTLLPGIKDLRISPMSVVTRGRVAVADEIASALNASVAVILIGERPGLKSPNSMGIYMTYRALPGTTDERRNCISNVRPEGLSYEAAASKLEWLIRQSMQRMISGVDLKDEQPAAELSTDPMDTLVSA
jgi:ethanolamine ammonia-lyase small subunit